MTPQSLNRPELDEPLLASHNEDTNAPASSDPTLLILDTPSGPPLDSHDPTDPQTSQCSSKAAIMNLVNTTLGAGMMALPFAFARLGLGVGAIALFLCGWLTAFSLVGLVKASVRSQRLASYADLVKHSFGQRGSSLLQFAIVANNAGSLVIYLIIVMDVLVGSAPEYAGLLSLLSPNTGHVWYLSRAFVIMGVCAVVLAPLLALRNMAALSKASIVAVGAASFFALSTVLLTARALYTGGALGRDDWAPSERELGSSPLHIIIGIVSTIPILVTSFLCHFNVHPVMAELRNFSEKKMKDICRTSISITGTIYLLVGAGACLIFGSTTKEDVLENFSVPVLAGLLNGNHKGAVVLSAAIRASYAVSLLFTFPLIFYPLRAALVEMTAGVPFQDLTPSAFYAISYALLTLFFLVATQAPGIWIALQLSGSTASVLISFILPALLVLRMERTARDAKPHVAALCYILAGLGILCGAVGVGSVIHDLFADVGPGGDGGPFLVERGARALRHVWMFK